jgi:predicted TIM-barrel fold metal-dependent hydrolase
MLNLDAVPVVDNHCHSFLRDATHLDARGYRGLFTEARRDGPSVPYVGSAVYYRWALKELARVLHCEPVEASVLSARAQYTLEELTGVLFAEARIEAMLIDTGLGGAEFFTIPEMRALTGCRVEWVLRLETLAQELILSTVSFGEFTARLTKALTHLRGQGVVSLKSIAAYRSGLQIEPTTDRDASSAYGDARVQAQLKGQLRLTSKPLIDWLIWRAMEQAAEQGIPIQFHTGYGDPDLDMRLANPLHLRPLFEEPAFETVPIVLLHESYPYTRESAYLTAVYPNAFLDISYSVPFLDYHELLHCTHQALGTAPWEKILYSSDGFGIPEHAWLGAVHGRRVLRDALWQKVEQDELTEAAAMEAAKAIFAENSRRLYRL